MQPWWMALGRQEGKRSSSQGRMSQGNSWTSFQASQPSCDSRCQTLKTKSLILTCEIVGTGSTVLVLFAEPGSLLDMLKQTLDDPLYLRPMCVAA